MKHRREILSDGACMILYTLAWIMMALVIVWHLADVEMIQPSPRWQYVDQFGHYHFGMDGDESDE